MFCVIFEVQPKEDRFDAYLEQAKHLKPRLEATDGFIDNERFSSRRTPGRLLSLSTWRDEKAVVRWRTQAEHHRAQERGRFELFADYHLRVGEVIADSAPPAAANLEQRRFDETEAGAAKLVTITELVAHTGTTGTLPAVLGLEAGAAGLIEHEVFESIYTRGKLLLLASWRAVDAAARWMPRPPAGAGDSALRHRAVRIIRDYGLFDRREAPQYYPEVER
jgi:heme-degrading monooxygenase HmoA